MKRRKERDNLGGVMCNFELGLNSNAIVTRLAARLVLSLFKRSLAFFVSLAGF